MISLGKRFEKYTGWLRRLKLVYVLNNLMNAQQLKHNRQLYKDFGLKKSIYLPIGSHELEGPFPIPSPLADQEDAPRSFQAHANWPAIEARWKPALLEFPEKGYLILRNFFSTAQVQQANKAIDRLLTQKIVDFNYTGRKVSNAHEFSTEILDLYTDEKLLSILTVLLGRQVIPFQSLNFIYGSEQAIHSDAIHMSTAPRGYLIAAWIALEPVTVENGPVTYYPGSHRLPYLSTRDYDSGNTRWMIGAQSNKQYEKYIAAKLDNLDLKPEIFLADPGDVLIWHANLLHGGSPIKKEGTTRRSMVAHYFGAGVICYHEITQRPALINH